MPVDMGSRLRVAGRMDVVLRADEAGALQKWDVVHNLQRRALARDAAGVEDVAAVRSCDDHRFPAVSPMPVDMGVGLKVAGRMDVVLGADEPGATRPRLRT